MESITAQPPVGPEDSELVEQANSGDLAAFETLISRHERLLYTIALRITGSPEDAQDVTQDAILSAIEHLKDFRGEAKFGTWIRRITTHGALKVLRKRQGLPRVSLDAALEPAESYASVPHPDFIAEWGKSPRDLLERHETRAMIDAALAELEERHRLVFLLRDVEGFSIRETAESLGISEVNVKVRLLRARLQLRERLTRQWGDPAKRYQPHAHAHE